VKSALHHLRGLDAAATGVIVPASGPPRPVLPPRLEDQNASTANAAGVNCDDDRLADAAAETVCGPSNIEEVCAAVFMPLKSSHDPAPSQLAAEICVIQRYCNRAFCDIHPVSRCCITNLMDQCVCSVE
jgi:hypothetical protein